MKVSVIAHPGSRKPRIEEDLFGSLHVYVAEPALEGRANEAVRKSLAEHLKASRSSVVLVKGHKSKQKIFEVG